MSEQMPSVKITGENNKLYIREKGTLSEYREIQGLNITITGNNNEITIELPSKFINTAIVMNGDENSILIKATRHRYIRHTTFGMENGGKITFGGGISVYKNLNVVAKAGKRIDIGDECMFARDIIVRNDDGHTIIDAVTGDIINAPENIKIADKVWIGSRSMILKGAEIAEGSVVGAMALVNKKFKDKNIIIAGVPAKKVKENIIWDRADYYTYCEKLVD